MANAKLTALTELTTIATGDMLYVVDDPGGTPVSKKITVNNLLNTPLLISQLSQDSSPTIGNDYLVSLDSATNTLKKVLMEDIPLSPNAIWLLTADAAPNPAQDYLVSWDLTTETLKKVKMEDIPGVGVVAGEMSLNATEWWPSTTNGCAALAKSEFATFDIDIQTLDFDQTTNEYAQTTVWMPDDWDGGNVTFKIIWTAAAGTGDVYWRMAAVGYGDDDAIDQAATPFVGMTDTLLATGDMHITSVSGNVTPAGSPAAGSPIQLKLQRFASDAADTLTGDAKFIGLKLYYATT